MKDNLFGFDFISYSLYEAICFENKACITKLLFFWLDGGEDDHNDHDDGDHDDGDDHDVDKNAILWC